MPSQFHRNIGRPARPDTAAEIAERVAFREAWRLAHADTIECFGAITADNIGAALAYQEERIRLRRLGRV